MRLQSRLRCDVERGHEVAPAQQLAPQPASLSRGDGQVDEAQDAGAGLSAVIGGTLDSIPGAAAVLGSYPLIVTTGTSFATRRARPAFSVASTTSVTSL